MKIAFVDQPIGRLIIPPTSSIGIWIYEVARRLAQSCEVVVYGRRGRRQPPSEDVKGVRYRRITLFREARYVGRLFRLLDRLSGLVRRPYASGLYYLDYAWQVARDVRAEGCDVVHLSNFSQFAPVIRALNPRVKIVLHMHCEWLSLLDRGMIERRLRAIDLIVGCSEYIAEKIRRRFPQFADRCQVIPNGVDVASFTGTNGHRAAREDRVRRLLFVGRVSPEKGLHVLLEAFRLIAERLPHVRLEIVGSHKQLPLDYLLSLGDDEAIPRLASFYDGRSDESYFARLQDQLQTLPLAEHVTFTGALPYVQLREHYHQADVLINPSFSESFGRSLIEAMACELPVVATRIGGMTELLAGSNAGLLVEPGDAPALAEAALRLLTDNDLRQAMGQAGQRWVLERFSWEQVAAGLRDQCRHLC